MQLRYLLLIFALILLINAWPWDSKKNKKVQQDYYKHDDNDEYYDEEDDEEDNDYFLKTHKKQWYRGQLHAHANWGPPQLPWTSPDVVVKWYREHQFNFVVIADLNYYTPVDGLKKVYDAPDRFIVIPGTELSAEPLGVGIKIIDSLGIGIRPDIEFTEISTGVNTGATTNQVLKSQAYDIKKANGLHIIAHPSLTYAINADDFLQLCKDDDLLFFEVYNAEPGMNNLGGGDSDSTEEMWDKVLSKNCVMYGVATDDSHHFRKFIESDVPDEPLANPGKAWIQVRSNELNWKSLRKAMEEGDFYATTGLKFLDYEVTNHGVYIELDGTTRDLGWSTDNSNPQKYTTTFIGKNGSILKVDKSLTPFYTFKTADLYVRAKVVSSDGYIAWTQPVFPGRCKDKK